MLKRKFEGFWKVAEMTLNIPIAGQRKLIDMLNNQVGNFCHISAILGLKVMENDENR